jgi:hypothetical protein
MFPLEISNETDIQQQIDIENQIQFELDERRSFVRNSTYLLILSLGCFTLVGYTAYYEYLTKYGL